MTKCVFCGKDESPHKGVTMITNDGLTHFYCSKKCRLSALKFKRDKTRLKWTEAYRIAKEKIVSEAKKNQEKAKKASEEAKKAEDKK
jgi:large subunit ribosomal protein L24e